MSDNNFIQRINNSFAKLAEWVLDHRKIVIIICLVMIIGVAFLFSKLRYNFDPFNYVPDNTSTTEFYEKLVKEYGNDEFAYILYTAKQGNFNLDVLKKTRTLVEDLKGIPYIKKVHSITNLEFMEGDKNGVIKVSRFMEKFPASQTEADRLQVRLLDKPMYINTYISKDAKYAAIFCEIDDKREEDSSYAIKIWAGLKEVLSKPLYKDFKFYPTGTPVIAATLIESYDENIRIFTIPSVVLTLLLLIFLFRQLKGIISPYLVVELTLLLLIGFLAITGLHISLLFSMVPTILLAIGMADSIHIISEYQIHLKTGFDNRTSILKTVKLLGFPCLFTSITTAVGFLSLTNSGILPFREIGLSVAFGSVAAFIVTFTILLVVLSFAGEKTERKFQDVKVKKDNGLMHQGLVWIANFNNRYYKIVLLVFIVITIISVYGVTKIEVNSSNFTQFGDDVPMVNDFKFVDKTMGGTCNFEVLLDSKKADGVKTLQFIQTLEKIQNFADTQVYLVKKTISITDMIKDVNRALNNNDKTFSRIPSSEGDELQNINEFIYELYGGDELERFVSGDLSEARLTIYVRTSDAVEYDRFNEDIRSFIESVKPEHYTYTITGEGFVHISIYHSMTKDMLGSLSLAVLLISIMMIFVFRSFKVGFISMIPNIFPILFVLGYMGLSGIWLSYVTSVCGCIMIGLVVDDTIHLISRYRMEFASLGNYKKALAASMSGVGRALTITTIIMCVSFGVCMFSKNDTFHYLGLVVSLGFIVALLADFFIAPSLILLFKPFGKEFTPVKEADIQAEVTV